MMNSSLRPILPLQQLSTFCHSCHIFCWEFRANDKLLALSTSLYSHRRTRQDQPRFVIPSNSAAVARFPEIVPFLQCVSTEVQTGPNIAFG